jgi:hypothetical protein
MFEKLLKTPQETNRPECDLEVAQSKPEYHKAEIHFYGSFIS